jgi:hypothetical protein
VIIAAQTTPAWLETARDAFSNAYAVNCGLAGVGMLALALVAKRVLQNSTPSRASDRPLS